MHNLERWVAVRDPSLEIGWGCFWKGYLVRDQIGGFTETKGSIAQFRGGLLWRNISKGVRDDKPLLCDESFTYIIIFSLLHIYAQAIRF